MARQSFRDPDDVGEDVDILGELSAPIRRPSAPPGDQGRTAASAAASLMPPPRAGSVPESAPPLATAVLPGPELRTDHTGAPARKSRPPRPTRRSATPPTSARPAPRTSRSADGTGEARTATGKPHKINLYVDELGFLAFKRISLERAAQGLAYDYSTFSLEALEARYPGQRWRR